MQTCVLDKSNYITKYAVALWSDIWDQVFQDLHCLNPNNMHVFAVQVCIKT